MMTTSTHNETASDYELDAFAEYYEALSDSFIDIKRAAHSLKAQINKESRIFEIGMGTGYFASQFHYDGYNICGIQPSDKMLGRLKREHPSIEVKAEEYLGDYVFDSEYDVIISHISVFLFTKLEMPFATGETQVMLVFQSFIEDQTQVFSNIEKVMKALAPDGRLFINIQTNPKRRVQVRDNLIYEMLQCRYDFDRNRVVKIFCTTYKGEIYPSRDVYYVLRYSNFERIIKEKEYQCKITEDGEWVVLSRASSR